MYWLPAATTAGLLSKRATISPAANCTAVPTARPKPRQMPTAYRKVCIARRGCPAPRFWAARADTARPQVLGRQGRHGGQHRGRHQKDEADHLLDDAHRRRVVQAAVVGDDGDQDEGHLHKAVLHRHRQPHPQDGAEDVPPGAQAVPRQGQAGLLPGNDRQRRHDAQRLGQRRAEGRALAAQATATKYIGLFESPSPRKIELMML